MRVKFYGRAESPTGDAIASATVKIYLAGTSTPATAYTTVSSTTPVSQVTTDQYGYYTFYINAFDYDQSQLFDLVLNKLGSATTYTFYNIQSDNIIPGTYDIDENTVVSGHVYIPKGVTLNISNGITLTFTVMPEIGLYSVFTGAGKVVFPNGCRVYIDWFNDSLATVVTNIDTADATVVISDTVAVAENIIAPNNICLSFESPGKLDIDTSYTVTIGKMSCSNLYQIFDGAGTVVLSSGAVKEIYPEWWGTTAAAINLALLSSDSPTVVLTASSYNISTTTISITKSDTKLIFLGGCYLNYSGTGVALTIDDTANTNIVYRVTIENPSILATGSAVTAAGGVGIKLVGARCCTIIRPKVHEFNSGKGIWLTGINGYYGASNMIIQPLVEHNKIGIEFDGYSASYADFASMIIGGFSIGLNHATSGSIGINIKQYANSVQVYNTDIETYETGVVMNAEKGGLFGTRSEYTTTHISVGATGIRNVILGHQKTGSGTYLSDLGTLTTWLDADSVLQAGVAGITVAHNTPIYFKDTGETQRQCLKYATNETMVFGCTTFTGFLGNFGQGPWNFNDLRINDLPTYADNTAALLGGLIAGQLYRTAAGVVMVAYTP